MVREHLLDGVPVSAIVDQHKIHAVQYAPWQKQRFEEGAVVFERKANGHNVRRQESAKDEKIERLEAKSPQKNDVMAKLLEEHIKLKKELGGTPKQRWVPHEIRDKVVDTIRTWPEKTDSVLKDSVLKDILGWAELHSSTFNNGTRSYGRADELSAKVPRDRWLTEDEKQAIIRFHHEHPLNGYRRLSYMMLDADIVACSPGTVHRLLSSAGLLSRFGKRAS